MALCIDLRLHICQPTVGYGLEFISPSAERLVSVGVSTYGITRRDSRSSVVGEVSVGVPQRVGKKMKEPDTMDIDYS